MTLSPRLFAPIRAKDEGRLTNGGRGRSCQLVMVKVTELRLCRTSHASPHWPLQHVLSATGALQHCTVYCVHLYCVLCCHNRYIPTGSWLQVASYTDASRFYKSQETVFLPSYWMTTTQKNPIQITAERVIVKSPPPPKFDNDNSKIWKSKCKVRPSWSFHWVCLMLDDLHVCQLRIWDIGLRNLGTGLRLVNLNKISMNMSC